MKYIYSFLIEFEELHTAQNVGYLCVKLWKSVTEIYSLVTSYSLEIPGPSIWSRKIRLSSDEWMIQPFPYFCGIGDNGLKFKPTSIKIVGG